MLKNPVSLQHGNLILLFRIPILTHLFEEVIRPFNRLHYSIIKSVIQRLITNLSRFLSVEKYIMIHAINTY